MTFYQVICIILSVTLSMIVVNYKQDRPGLNDLLRVIRAHKKAKNECSCWRIEKTMIAVCLLGTLILL